MSDIHVLSSNLGKHWNVVFHFDVPDVNNMRGVNYRTALVNSGIGGTTSLPEGTGAGMISAAEKALVESGEVFEHSTTYLVESGGTTNVELRATLREFYAIEETRIIANLQQRLRYFGHTETRA